MLGGDGDGAGDATREGGLRDDGGATPGEILAPRAGETRVRILPGRRRGGASLTRVRAGPRPGAPAGSPTGRRPRALPRSGPLRRRHGRGRGPPSPRGGAQARSEQPAGLGIRVSCGGKEPEAVLRPRGAPPGELRGKLRSARGSGARPGAGAGWCLSLPAGGPAPQPAAVPAPGPGAAQGEDVPRRRLPRAARQRARLTPAPGRLPHTNGRTRRAYGSDRPARCVPSMPKPGAARGAARPGAQASSPRSPLARGPAPQARPGSPVPRVAGCRLPGWTQKAEAKGGDPTPWGGAVCPGPQICATTTSSLKTRACGPSSRRRGRRLRRGRTQDGPSARARGSWIQVPEKQGRVQLGASSSRTSVRGPRPPSPAPPAPPQPGVHPPAPTSRDPNVVAPSPTSALGSPGHWSFGLPFFQVPSRRPAAFPTRRTPPPRYLAAGRAPGAVWGRPGGAAGWPHRLRGGPGGARAVAPGSRRPPRPRRLGGAGTAPRAGRGQPEPRPRPRPLASPAPAPLAFPGGGVSSNGGAAPPTWTRTPSQGGKHLNRAPSIDSAGGASGRLPGGPPAPQLPAGVETQTSVPPPGRKSRPWRPSFPRREPQGVSTPAPQPTVLFWGQVCPRTSQGPGPGHRETSEVRILGSSLYHALPPRDGNQPHMELCIRS